MLNRTQRIRPSLEIDGARGKPETLGRLRIVPGFKGVWRKNSELFLISQPSIDALLVITPTWITLAEFPSWSEGWIHSKVPFHLSDQKRISPNLCFDWRVSSVLKQKLLKKTERNQPFIMKKMWKRPRPLEAQITGKEFWDRRRSNVLFKDAGLIWGPAMVEITNSDVKKARRKQEVCFTGDLGYPPNRLCTTEVRMMPVLWS